MFLYNYQVKKKQPAIGGLLEVMTRHIVAAGQTYKRSEIVPIGYNFLSVPRSAVNHGRERDTWILFTIVIAPAPSWVSLARAMRAGNGGRWRKGGMGGNVTGVAQKTDFVSMLLATLHNNLLFCERRLWGELLRATNKPAHGAGLWRDEPHGRSGQRPSWGRCDRCAPYAALDGRAPPHLSTK